MAPVWTSVFLAASALVTVSAAEDTVLITGCQNGTINIFEGNSLYLYCYDATNADGIFHWTLRTENGTEVPLGTCHEVNNCTSQMATPGLTRSSSFRSQLYRYSTMKSMSGDITCTVSTVGRNVVGTDTCRVNVYRVPAYTDMLNLLDGNRLYRGISVSPFGRSRITVTVTVESGETIVLGVCTKGYSLCTSLTDNFQIYNGTSYMSISSQTELERRFAGRVLISVTFGSKVETAHFMINLYSYPSADNCSIDVHSHNWTAVLSCDVRHAFSSAGIYRFRLLEYTPYFFNQNSIYNLRYGSSSSGLKRHEDQNFFPNMHSYFNTTDNKTYYEGRLEYSWRLSTLNKDFKYGSILLCTSTNDNNCVFSTPLFIRLPNVAMPAALSHNCSQLSHIPENGAITCTCSTGSVGSPAGRLLWLLDNVVWTTGQYGVTQLSLSIDSLTRSQTARQATCRLDWIEPQDAHPPLNIAYVNKDPSDSDSDRMKWSAIGGGVMLAVGVVVTLLVMMVICICRRGHLCFAPQPGGVQETCTTTDQHLYESLKSTVSNTAGNRGKPQSAERDSSIYENSGFSGVAENHM